MEMQGDQGYFLSDILNGVPVAGLDDLNFGFTQETETHEELVQASNSTKGARRKKNFHYTEDEIICSGWLNVSKDPINGANQSKTTFWGRVHAYYEEHNKSGAVRTESSIMHRWLAIQCSVNKFCSCYEQILRRNQSGTTLDDKVC
jgi:hypothetical protein